MANKINLEVNANRLVLSSSTMIYKTESFFYQTKKIVNIDFFILKLAENLQTKLDALVELSKQFPCFEVKTKNEEFSFLFVIGKQLESQVYGINDLDIVFFEMTGGNQDLKTKDQRVSLFLNQSKIFSVNVFGSTKDFDKSVFKKNYLLSSSNYINFPMLSEKQHKLVEIENQNVLVQGVAGSGKTNICISKIIFSACKNYSGKVLYTTFSRGLLIDTKQKIDIYKNSIKNLIDDYKAGRITFLDKNHKKAIENRLGISVAADNEQNLIKQIAQIVDFLETHIDYKLLEDLYKDYNDEKMQLSDENDFIKSFLPNLQNHQLKNRLQKIKNISYSIIYKEIYGMIFGSFKAEGILSFEEYKQKRENSFSPVECEIIYALAMEYHKYQKAHNLIDNNEISRQLLKIKDKIKKYSLSIIDEVQDYTEVNLNLFKEISIKMFCVGDALQMINPAYFSFAYLKQLMYREDVTNVAELECNYRNNKKIVELLDGLSEISMTQFGTHSFVLSGESIDENSVTNTICTFDKKFIDKIKSEKFENFTILVNDQKEKAFLKGLIGKQEILTISEIKGLERETVVLYNILSSNLDKWNQLLSLKINHKTADENSVFRYYFNLFYVGLSRAKHNIFVFEENQIAIFDEYFKQNFDILDGNTAFLKFSELISKVEIDEDEIYERINEFLKLGQFDNARFYAEKLDNDFESRQQFEKIDAYEQFIFKGMNKQAGIKLWKAGLLNEAKEQFEICGETKLIEFLESLSNKNQTNLDAEIVRFFTDFEENTEAQDLIIDVLNQDIEKLQSAHKNIKSKLKVFKEKNNG